MAGKASVFAKSDDICQENADMVPFAAAGGSFSGKGCAVCSLLCFRRGCRRGENGTV